MSNKNLFSNKTKNKYTSSPKITRATDTRNEAGGTAYQLSDKAALAQYAMTGTFNGTYYTSDTDQLQKVLELSTKVSPKFVAQLAVYARQKGLMKDMPAVLAAVVASRDTDLLAQIFDKVIDSPKMLRNFVQIIRSGVTGKKSFGTRTKRLIQNYLESLTDEQLFKADVGNDPSLQDIIKLVHPKPTNKKRSALYGYLLDKEYNKRDLLALAKEFERFKTELSGEIPDVPFQMLTALPLTDKHWKQIAENATWNQTRMNLNTFARHNVLKDSKLVKQLAERLSDPEQVRKARVFPYQLFTAFLNVDASIPVELTDALQDAADFSLDNIPEIPGTVYVMVDTSGSMSSAVTGNRGSVTTKMRVIDVAALFASAILRKNRSAEVIPFDTQVHPHRMNSRDSIMTNAKLLASFGGGGTDCASAIRYLNDKGAKGDFLMMISDNESWFNNKTYGRGTGMANEWSTFKKRNPNAKLVCLDVQPSATTQVNTQTDVLNLGGFNDSVFEVIAKFFEMGTDKDLWVSTIESVRL
jgi:60 kDa SS-A/Ro ribonucleoprotein